MTPERLQQVSRVYHDALTRDQHARDAFVCQACAGDESLRREVESLLAANDDLGAFMDKPAMELAASLLAADGAAVAPPERIGHYELVSPIGVGGMGAVYRARDTQLNRPVAIKFLSQDLADESARRRFQQEAQMASALNHPHILTVHDAGEVDGRQYLVTEFVDGGTLEDWARAERRSWRQVVDLLVGVGDGLATAHAAGILHRDIKPGNVLVSKSGYAKLADFGLAKLDTHERVEAVTRPTTAPTRPGMILGTIPYMSPEQAAGKTLDARSDIFSFGVVLYELLAARRPFRGATDLEVLQTIIHGTPEPVDAAVPIELRLLVEKSLEKAPADRYQTMRDLVVDLTRVQRHSSANTETGLQHGERSKLWQQRSGTSGTTAHDHVGSGRHASRWAAGIAAGVVVILLGFLVVPRFLGPTTRTPAASFVLLPPEGTSFGGGAIDRTPPLAISPDGERLAFVATDRRQNHPMLWVRALRSLTAVPLGGTDGAREPFWSPDGAFLGFFADGKLKKVAASGGTPTTLADAPLGSGGTWNRDGVIAFAPDTQSGLLRVSDIGGTPMPVTRLNKGEYGHVYPQFLPDGRHLLYLARAVPSRKGIYVTSIDSTGTTFVVAARERARYAVPGHLMVLQDGRLMARAFDPNTLQLLSEPVSVADSVAFIATDGRASYDVSDTGVLVYRANGLLASSQPVWVDVTGKTVATVGEPGDYQTAGVSPDGSKVAVEKHDLRTSTGDLWLIDLRRGSTSRLTFDGMHNNAAIWSPDNKSIVFTSRPDGTRNLHVKVVGAESDEPLLASGPDRTPTDWSSDGRRILYQEGIAPRRDIWVLQMPERQPAPFLRSEADETGGQFSPDGHWVAYVSDETGKTEVYVRSYPRAEGKHQVSVNGGMAPRWSRNGMELFYVSRDAAVMAVSVSTRGQFEAGAPRVLFATDMRRGDNDGLITAGAWFAVDGRRFFIVPNPPGPLPPAPPITVMTDWTALLAK